MLNSQRGNISDLTSYTAGLPYPNVKVACPNPFYGQLLLFDYCSCVSELRAVMQYNYHRMRLSQCYPEIAFVLNCICSVEMLHTDLLSELILQNNCDPKYRTLQNGQNCYYRCTPDCCDYSKTVGKILLENIALEKAQIEQYKMRCVQIADETVTSVLKHIIMDEEIHIKILTDLYYKYCGV